MAVLTTVYEGVRYRSRAEARWAVVFDALGWRHNYEPEAYLLPSGGYLPDFYLPDVDAFFEVKGRQPTALERRKASELCVETATTVVVTTGPPNPFRKEWDEDLLTFVPETDDGIEWWAFEYEGGFVSRRRDYHPCCSISLGNLGHLGSNVEIDWQSAFLRAVNNRFGIHE